MNSFSAEIQTYDTQPNFELPERKISENLHGHQKIQTWSRAIIQNLLKNQISVTM